MELCLTVVFVAPAPHCSDHICSQAYATSRRGVAYILIQHAAAMQLFP